jgi:hypothetical protein
MQKHPTTSVQAEIILGIPSEGCQGHGICRILTQSALKSVKCPSITGYITLEADQKLRFSFPKAAMPAALKEKHFSSPWFTVKESFVLPNRIAAQFEFKRSQIQPGLYQITETACFFIVSL